ncbi:hypothetical protein FNF31_02500 [Cafeteria roenbergensis]|nr:hypothetical protein FNF31_02500 [Cafeteria roenbergensis]
MAAATPASPAASTASGPVASAEAKPYDAIVRRCHPSAHYDIDRRALGKGSFGTVFQGVDKSSGLTVALKFSHNHLKEPAMKGARDEAVAMQEIMDRTKRHPNLAKFIAVYEFPNPHARTGVCIVLVLQLWAGGSLLEKVMDLIGKGVWSEAYAAQAFSQLLQSMKAMHEADGTGSFVHCDVKLDNDFVSDDSRDAYAITGDFGETVWVPRDPANPHRTFRRRRFVGTATYAAPEQLIADSSGHHTYSPAADMWSMGVTLFCILNQAFPFPREDGPKLREAVRSARHYAFHRAVQDDAKDLIEKLLSVDPTARPTAAEALEHPWIRRATVGDLAATRSMFNLPTAGAGGVIVKGVAEEAADLSVTNSADRLLSQLGGGLSLEQFNLIRTKLGEVLGAGYDIKTAELTEEQFEEVMSKISIRGLVISRLFRVLDTDGNGKLSVDELTMGISRITEPSEDRARLVFSMYDADGDGSVTMKELTDVLRACATDDPALERVKAERLVAELSALDVDKSGVVTLEQFLEAVGRNPFLAKLMLQPNEHFRRFVSVAPSTA